MKIAYFILVHRYPNQFKKMFRAIFEPENIYLIHVDKRAGKKLQNEIQNFLTDFPNSHILTSQGVVWGGYSMVSAELRGIKKLLELDSNWDYFINLSGQDFPLKSQTAIKEFLTINKGRDFLKILNQWQDRPITLNRINNYFVETTNGFKGKPYKRPYLSQVTPYIGGQWKILSRSGCEFISNSSKVARFRSYYRHTLIPDESFFQTVLMNTNYPNPIINDDKRAIIWIPDIRIKLGSKKTFKNADTQSLVESGKIKLRPKVFTTEDLSYLVTSEALFARKFDETVDFAILDLLESRLQISNSKKFKKANKINPGFNEMPISTILSLPLSTIKKNGKMHSLPITTPRLTN